MLCKDQKKLCVMADGLRPSVHDGMNMYLVGGLNNEDVAVLIHHNNVFHQLQTESQLAILKNILGHRVNNGYTGPEEGFSYEKIREEVRKLQLDQVNNNSGRNDNHATGRGRTDVGKDLNVIQGVNLSNSAIGRLMAGPIYPAGFEADLDFLDDIAPMKTSTGTGVNPARASSSIESIVSSVAGGSGALPVLKKRPSSLRKPQSDKRSATQSNNKVDAQKDGDQSAVKRGRGRKRPRHH